MTYFIICICQPYSSVLEVHVKWFLNELLVSLIMPLLSSKSVDEKRRKPLEIRYINMELINLYNLIPSQYS